MQIIEKTESPPDNRRQVLLVPLEDPRVAPMLSELVAEYSARYGNRFGGAEQEMRRYPAADFAPPGGTLLVVVENGITVAGGAFRQLDERTAELKRIWTSSVHRRRGLARFVLAELEEEAARRGYSRIYLTTGPRQPEARGLYLHTGYRPLFDIRADPEVIGRLAFEKELTDSGTTPGAGTPTDSGTTPGVGTSQTSGTQHSTSQNHPSQNHPNQHTANPTQPNQHGVHRNHSTFPTGA